MTKEYRLYKVTLSLVLIQSLVCNAEQVEFRNLGIEDAMIEQTKGDIDDLYDKWIKGRWQILNERKEFGFFTHDSGIAASQDIESGMRRFCSSVDGNFARRNQQWGWIFTCHDKGEQLIGKISIQTYKNPDRIKVFLDSPKTIAQDKKALQLDAWRSRLNIGSDTFCGPVIELRHPMVKIAVNPQIGSLGAEAWLKLPQVFPPEYGCLNTNGRLAPLQTP